MIDSQGCIIKGIREAVPKGINTTKAFNEKQKKEESPSEWLERLRKNIQQYSGINPESAAEQQLLKATFVTHS